MISVTVAHNDTSVSLEAEAGYSPDLCDDLCRRASATLAATYGVTAGTLRQWVRRGHVKTYSDEQVELFDVLQRITEG